MLTDREIKDLAEDTFRALKADVSQINGFLDFWKSGNCFDTLTDYLAVVRPDATDQDLLAGVLGKYQRTSGCWYDDYAWWAIASAKVYDARFRTIFGGYAQDFAAIAQECWKKVDQGLSDGVHLGAPAGFTNKDNQTKFITPPPLKDYWVTPRFDNGRGSGLHGVWQYDIFCNEREAPNWQGPPECGPNPCWPWQCALGPYQDTVVNALYFLLAQRLEQAHRDHADVATTASQLADEYGFLRAWLGLDPDNPIDDKYSLANWLTSAQVVVRERVGTYAFHDAYYPVVENWTDDCTWAGDQGLLLNALAGYRTMHPDDEMSARLIQPLVRGYMARLMSGGEPQPFYPPGEPPQGDYANYKSGIGVFMRGLLQALRTGDDLVRSLVTTAEFQQFLQSSVNWAGNAHPSDGFDRLNVLATLTLYIMLQNS